MRHVLLMAAVMGCAPDEDELARLAGTHFGDQVGTVQIGFEALDAAATCCPTNGPRSREDVVLTHPDDAGMHVFQSAGQVDADCMEAHGLLAPARVRQKTLSCAASDACSPSTLPWVGRDVRVSTPALEELRVAGGTERYPRFVAMRKVIGPMQSSERLGRDSLRAEFATTIEHTPLGACLKNPEKPPSDLTFEKQVTYLFERVDGAWR
jgi:hypothetical protein